MDRSPANAAPILFFLLLLAPVIHPVVAGEAATGPGEGGEERRELERLRATLEAAPPEERVAGMEELWKRELSAVPPSEHDRVRERMRSDLEALEKVGFESDPDWWRTLRIGYRMVGDDEAVDRIEAGMAASVPCVPESVGAALAPWTGFERSAGEEVGAERYRELYRRTGEWLELCPDELRFHFYRFVAVGHLDDLPVAEVREAADRWLAAWERRGDDASGIAPHFQVAWRFVDRGIDLHRAVGWLEQDLRRWAEPADEAPADERWTDEARRQARFFDAMPGLEHRTLLTRAYLALDRPEEARPHLGRRGDQLDALEALATEDPELQVHSWFLGELPRFRGEQSVLRAELAEAESRPLDALVHYRRGQELLPAGHPDLEKAARGVRLWRGLGGTDEGWAVLAELFEKAESSGGEAPPVLMMASGWREKDTPFPAFELFDLEGRRWRLADLAGKTVLVNFWATWCLPCRLELPHLQKLADELAGRPELAVVTLNVDENPGLVAPFVDREGFTFPALLAHGFTEEHDLPGGGIPQNWILDGDGVVRRWQSGFSAEKAEGWRESVLAELEAVASAR